MHKGRGKGKISNDLVAASCAAVLAVYAAGYSRTREAARRFETQAKERRPAASPTQRAPAISTRPPLIIAPPPVIEAIPVPAAHPEHRALATTVHKPVRARTASAPPATDEAAASVVASDSAPGAPPAIAPVPLPAQETNAPIPYPVARESAPVAGVKWRDGTYTGLGSSAHGDIEARVVIKEGRIVEAGIATCDTRYPCSVIDPLIQQPVERQSPDVDYLSRATESSAAYYYGLVEALEKAREPASGEAATPK